MMCLVNKVVTRKSESKIWPTQSESYGFYHNKGCAIAMKLFWRPADCSFGPGKNNINLAECFLDRSFDYISRNRKVKAEQYEL